MLKRQETIVDLVNFACLNCREFVIWGLFAKNFFSKIRELSISMISSAIKIVILANISRSDFK